MVGPVAGSCRSRIWRPWVRMGAECSSRRRRTSTGPVGIGVGHRAAGARPRARRKPVEQALLRAAVKALGERFILEEFDAALSAAASFVERVDGLSDFGRAALEAEVEKAEEPTVARLAAAFERAAVAERKRQAANKRVARLEVLLASFGGDAAFFAALDKRHPAWRETGTDPADIDGALDVAEPRVNRAKPVTVEHMFVVESEQAFPDASSAAWGQAGGRFADAAERARAVSQQLSDRARSRALAAEQEEPPASPDLVRRLFDWLRAHIEKLLEQLGLPPVRKTPEVLPPLSRHPAVLPPVRHQQVLPPVQRVPEVLLPARTAPQVLPPVCRREVLSPVRTTPEVLPPPQPSPRGSASGSPSAGSASGSESSRSSAASQDRTASSASGVPA